MSAFDITGAIVWTPLAFLFLRSALLGKWADFDDESVVLAFLITIGLILASVFCIARLFGAHT